MSLAPFFIFVLPILTVVAVAAVGSTRRLGLWLTLIASLFLTPVGGFILAIISGPKQRKPKRLRRRRFWESRPEAAPTPPESPVVPEAANGS